MDLGTKGWKLDWPHFQSFPVTYSEVDLRALNSAGVEVLVPKESALLLGDTARVLLCFRFGCCLDSFCFLCPEISKQEVTILAGVIDIYQGRGRTTIMMGAERNMWGTQMISLVDSWYSLAQL